MVYKGFGSGILEPHRPGAQWKADAVKLAGVPPLLDAIVNKGQETSRDNDAAQVVSMLQSRICRRIASTEGTYSATSVMALTRSWSLIHM